MRLTLAVLASLLLFAAPARAAILECRLPLGTILAEDAIEHYSAPQAFMRVASDPLIKGALELTGAQTLYGRRNVLRRPDGAVLADVVEILPP